jgi:hypothetical protein
MSISRTRGSPDNLGHLIDRRQRRRWISAHRRAQYPRGVAGRPRTSKHALLSRSVEPGVGRPWWLAASVRIVVLLLFDFVASGSSRASLASPSCRWGLREPARAPMGRSPLATASADLTVHGSSRRTRSVGSAEAAKRHQDPPKIGRPRAASGRSPRAPPATGLGHSP